MLSEVPSILTHLTRAHLGHLFVHLQLVELHQGVGEDPASSSFLVDLLISHLYSHVPLEGLIIFGLVIRAGELG